MPAGAPKKAERVDLVGYGLTSEGGTGAGTKRITESSIREVMDRRIIVEGTEDNDGGICNGDSGGPALTWSDARRRIAGVHSYKSGDCGTVSGHVRVDAHADWIASKSDGDLGCGAIDYRGACFGTTLAWCSGGDTLTYMQCADYANTPTCGWLNDEIGYSCLLADPGEVPPPGEPEPPQQQEPPAESGAQCDALGYVGACYGETSMWTENGDCRVRDCVAEGRSCGWIDDNTGWGCLGGQEGASTFSCGALDYSGQCMADDTLVWVENGACRVEHCPSTGRVCGWDDRPLADGSGPIGNNCLSG